MARRWRWRNVPVPRSHVAALAVGALLQRVRPWPLHRERGLVGAVGWLLVAAGAALAAWAVSTVGDGDVTALDELVTAGPYARGRNPMYVGWTLAYAGVSLAANVAWPLVLAPGVLAATHRVVRREERALEAAFGEEYRAYRRRTRRYL